VYEPIAINQQNIGASCTSGLSRHGQNASTAWWMMQQINVKKTGGLHK